MIVYSVARRWFTEKAPAEKYRVSLGLKPSATLKIEVTGREDLAILLNALCDPPTPGHEVRKPATAVLVDRAYVDPLKDVDLIIPEFLKKDWSVS